jgi:hypothetical protein
MSKLKSKPHLSCSSYSHPQSSLEGMAPTQQVCNWPSSRPIRPYGCSVDMLGLNQFTCSVSCSVLEGCAVLYVYTHQQHDASIRLLLQICLCSCSVLEGCTVLDVIRINNVMPVVILGPVCKRISPSASSHFWFSQGGFALVLQDLQCLLYRRVLHVVRPQSVAVSGQGSIFCTEELHNEPRQ